MSSCQAQCSPKPKESKSKGPPGILITLFVIFLFFGSLFYTLEHCVPYIRTFKWLTLIVIEYPGPCDSEIKAKVSWILKRYKGEYYWEAPDYYFNYLVFPDCSKVEPRDAEL